MSKERNFIRFVKKLLSATELFVTKIKLQFERLSLSAEKRSPGEIEIAKNSWTGSHPCVERAIIFLLTQQFNDGKFAVFVKLLNLWLRRAVDHGPTEPLG
ncbi:hypothetical protein SUGI_0461500 [Cryptomeria japonica]|nr:hypothetical protein SUGI_0461500 [Cryptomeria japonica]